MSTFANWAIATAIAIAIAVANVSNVVMSVERIVVVMRVEMIVVMKVEMIVGNYNKSMGSDEVGIVKGQL